MFFGGPSIKLVLFDVGGVFVDAELDRYIQIGCAIYQTNPEALTRAVLEHLPKLELGHIDSAVFWKLIGESLWRAGEGKIVIGNQQPNFWKNMFEATLSIDQRMIKVVQLLRDNGFQVGALCNTIADHADVLEKIGFYENFDPCIISCRAGLRKPDHDIYIRALSMAGVKPKQCLFIDDQPANVQAAIDAGMNGLVFTSVEQLCDDLTRMRLLL